MDKLITIKFLVYSGTSSGENEGVVKDISLDGAKIETDSEIKKGSIIEAGISSEGLPLIEIIAQVIWESAREENDKIIYEAGLQFIEIDESSREKLREYLVKCFS